MGIKSTALLLGSSENGMPSWLHERHEDELENDAGDGNRVVPASAS